MRLSCIILGLVEDRVSVLRIVSKLVTIMPAPFRIYVV